MKAYIVQETEKAYAVVIAGEATRLWTPKSKVENLQELDMPSKAFQFENEKVARQGVPVEIEINADFLKKVGK